MGAAGFSEDAAGDFALGSVFGMRIWDWSPGTRGYLMGSYGTAWTTPAMEAVCELNHAPPDLRCGCGIWAYWGSSPPHGQGRVLGVIEGYGRTLIGQYGFRCQKAVIRALVPGGPPEFSEWEPNPPFCPHTRPQEPQRVNIYAAFGRFPVTGMFTRLIPDQMFTTAGRTQLQARYDKKYELDLAGYRRALAQYDLDMRAWNAELPRLTAKYQSDLEAWHQRKAAWEKEMEGSIDPALGFYGAPLFATTEQMLAEYPCNPPEDQ